MRYRRDRMGGSDKRFDIGDLRRGESRDVRFYFFTDPDYRREKVLVFLDVSDVSGRFTMSDTLAFEIGQSIPTDVPWAVTDLYDTRKAAETKLGEIEARIRQVSAKVDSVAAARPTPPSNAQRVQPPDPNKVYTVKTDKAPIRGPSSAPITIATFSDFQ